MNQLQPPPLRKNSELLLRVAIASYGVACDNAIYQQLVCSERIDWFVGQLC